VGAPYYDSVTAVFLGRAAHSGVEPEAGANALSAAAHAIARTAVGRIDRETTANIGMIHGGRERNIIPDRVEIKGEVRSLSEERLRDQVEAMSASLRSVESESIRVEVETRREFDGFRFAKDHPAARLVQDGLIAVGLTPHFRLAGGGSDANIFNASGVPALVLSVGYNNAHAIEEQVHISDMATSVDYLVEMVRIAPRQPAEKQA
jgi:tripeptide aminopeptidase